MGFRDRLKKGMLLLDGGTGTMLQRFGMPMGTIPEILNIEQPDWILRLHRGYIEAGSDIVYANTFGANRLKLEGTKYTVDALVKAAIWLAKEAASGTDTLVALDIGPLGQLLAPTGTLSFEEAYDLFAEIAEAGKDADLVIIETMTDLQETKAAVLAAKEHTSLPVCVTMTFEENLRTFTGCSVPAMCLTLEGLGVDALGVNCSLGPRELLPIVREISAWTTLPIIVKPNAGLPDPVTNTYDITPGEFCEAVRQMLPFGPRVLGGCCGTDPSYIKGLRALIDGQMSDDLNSGKATAPTLSYTSYESAVDTGVPSGHSSALLGEASSLTGISAALADSQALSEPSSALAGSRSFSRSDEGLAQCQEDAESATDLENPTTLAIPRPLSVCSATRVVTVDRPRIIGERINPTGKKRFREALAAGDMDYILRQAIEQVEAGAEILDVNVGAPGVDEKQRMVQVVRALQGVTDVPLQLDSTKSEVLEAALRAYVGKPIINSVNGEQAVMDKILPLAAKYGAAVVGLTLDENGIPAKAEERFKIAERIVKEAEKYGIPRENVIIDCLVLTVSSEQKAAQETLRAVRMVREKLGLNTCLGVSNISFGLPARGAVNTAFFTMALQSGLTLPIMNPNVSSMMWAYRAFLALTAKDENSLEYIGYAAEHKTDAEALAELRKAPVAAPAELEA
ncbi:MAG: homocysteine S-methyltransferase family protein, partial [Lachnospiraceae bacterium]